MINFSYDSYFSLLNKIKKLNYKIGPLCDFPKTGDAVILRHDIDFSVSRALEMAKMEKAASVRSTYFVMMSSPFYNVLTLENMNSLRKIKAFGHEIGLHYDSSLFEDLNQDQMNQRMRVMIQTLETILDMRITSISQHKPATSRLRPQFAKYRDAYSPEYTKEIGYLSDSRMHFAVNDVLGFFRQHSRSQLLIHPIWWNKKPLNRETIFNNFRETSSAEVIDHINKFEAGIKAYFANESRLS